MHKTKLYLRKHTPLILTCLAAVGTVATAVLVATETPKALRLLEGAAKEKGEPLTKAEVACTALPTYAPAIVAGLATIACIFGSNILSRHQQASLASAYALLDSYHREYRKKLAELHGEEADQEVRDAIVRSRCNFHPLGVVEPDRKVIFYEEVSGESIARYEREVMDAEYHLNRNFVLRGVASLNEFYAFLGLPETRYGDEVGWTVADGYSWIDFEHRLVSRDDGGDDVCVIDLLFPPHAGYLDY